MAYMPILFNFHGIKNEEYIDEVGMKMKMEQPGPHDIDNNLRSFNVLVELFN